MSFSLQVNSSREMKGIKRADKEVSYAMSKDVFYLLTVIPKDHLVGGHRVCCGYE